MFSVEDDGRKAYNSIKAVTEVGSTMVVAYGPNREAALGELRINLRNIRDEIEVRLAELKGAE